MRSLAAAFGAQPLRAGCRLRCWPYQRRHRPRPCREVVAFDLTAGDAEPGLRSLAAEKGPKQYFGTEQGGCRPRCRFPDGRPLTWSPAGIVLTIGLLLRPGAGGMPAGTTSGPVAFLLCDIIAPEDLAVDTFLQNSRIFYATPSHVPRPSPFGMGKPTWQRPASRSIT